MQIRAQVNAITSSHIQKCTTRSCVLFKQRNTVSLTKAHSRNKLNYGLRPFVYLFNADIFIKTVAVSIKCKYNSVHILEWQ